MTERFDQGFATAITKASEGRDVIEGSSGVVAFGVGKKVGVAVQIVDGQVTDARELEPEATMAFANGAQVEQWLAGDLNLSQAFMRGDFKPTGSIRAIAAALELMDDPKVLAKLANL